MSKFHSGCRNFDIPKCNTIHHHLTHNNNKNTTSTSPVVEGEVDVCCCGGGVLLTMMMIIIIVMVVGCATTMLLCMQQQNICVCTKKIINAFLYHNSISASTRFKECVMMSKCLKKFVEIYFFKILTSGYLTSALRVHSNSS